MSPEDLQILNRIARALNQSLTLQDALDSTLRLVGQLLKLETSWIFINDPQAQLPYLAAAQNLPTGLLEKPEKMEGDCYCLELFQAGKMSDAGANINIITCSRLKWLTPEGREGLQYHASIPLLAHGERVGLLNVAGRNWRELTEEELSLLYIIGDMVGITIERARLFEESSRLGAVEERNRLAREMHDTLAQDLTGLTLQLETAEALLDADTPSQQLAPYISQALNTVRRCLDDVQRSVLDLRAAPLEGKNLSEGIEALVEALEATHGQPIKRVLPLANENLSSRIEIGLYRIAQEGLRNALEHAAATEIELSLIQTLEAVRLRIRDNGIGFDSRTVQLGCYGLIGMRERTQLLGGQFQLESTPGEGTLVEVSIPLTIHPS